jgi:hypothetical protein
VRDRRRINAVGDEHEHVACVGPHSIDAALGRRVQVDEVRLAAQVVLNAQRIALIGKRLLVARVTIELVA